MVEKRLREISDQLYELRRYLSIEPGNAIMIGLLESERRELCRRYIKGVT